MPVCKAWLAAPGEKGQLAAGAHAANRVRSRVREINVAFAVGDDAMWIAKGRSPLAAPDQCRNGLEGGWTIRLAAALMALRIVPACKTTIAIRTRLQFVCAQNLTQPSVV